ncbi:MAG: transcription termination/antitermination protein NusA [Clostridia bacterium]|nr:transcription termination/antitermination protein NusA [Clostridia bacterium]
MMNSEFFDAIAMLEAQRGIPRDYMYAKVEAALQSACKRDRGSDALFRVSINPEKQEVKVFRQYNIVDEVTLPQSELTPAEAKEKGLKYFDPDDPKKRHAKTPAVGDIFEEEIIIKNLRRLAATNAKMVIVQGIREAERSNIIKEYEKKTEEIITATVERVDEETGNVTVNTGTSIARMLKSDLNPNDVLRAGDRIKVCVTELRRGATSGPIVTLSRSHPDFVRRLFELEIPEIADGTVEIKGIAREAGSRTKVAVVSNDQMVDPIGSCIGPRSSRINAILSELSGEKVDLIRYSDDVTEFVSAALAPATVRDVYVIDELPEGQKEGWRYTTRAIVDSDQLSLAIGALGQNARLAAKLTGCKIDIKTNEGVY